jgi:hypothetical protein
LNLPKHRRPPESQGVGRDPIWGIDVDELGPDLAYRPDPDRDGHGFVEPARPMSLGEYQDALRRTQDRWKKEEPSPNQGSTSDAGG